MSRDSKASGHRLQRSKRWRESAVPNLTPRQNIRDLILALGGVNDIEAMVLLRVLEALEAIERGLGPKAAQEAADVVRSVWLSQDAVAGEDPSASEEAAAFDPEMFDDGSAALAEALADGTVLH